MKALLLGAGGLLGRSLAAAAPPEADLVPLGRAALDITDRSALGDVIASERPSLIINAAAYTAVDRAEAEPGRAHAVNAAAVATLAERAAAARARVVHISTDYVFDGTGGAPYSEDSPPAPRSVYGRTKLEGERALLDSGAAALVIRTQWLYGDSGGFPLRMLERARAGQPTRVVHDQLGRPTSVHDLAPSIWRLARSASTGILHLAGGGEASWFDVAELVFLHAGRAGLLSPCSTAEFPTPAPRPADSRLDCSRAEQLLGGPLPPWRQSLEGILSQL